jgi:hypothetical protein
MVFKATFNNISAIAWRSVLLEEEYGSTLSELDEILLGKKHLIVRSMQSVPIITKVVSSNSAHGKVYLLQHYVIKFVSNLFVHQYNWPSRYNWNIVESDFLPVFFLLRNTNFCIFMNLFLFLFYQRPTTVYGIM